MAEPKRIGHTYNLAPFIEDKVKERFAQDIHRLITSDEKYAPRKKHIKLVEDRKEKIFQTEYHQLIGSGKGRPQNDPNSSEYVYQGIRKAQININGRLRSDTFTHSGVVSAKITGTTTEAQRERADRMTRLLNRYFDNDAVDFRSETEDLMAQFSIWGVGYMKTLWSNGEPEIRFVAMKDLILDAGSNNILNARRITHKLVRERKWFNDMRRQGLYVFENDWLPAEKSMSDAKGKDVGADNTDPETAFSDDDLVRAYEIHADVFIPRLKPDNYVDGDAVRPPMPPPLPPNAPKEQEDAWNEAVAAVKSWEPPPIVEDVEVKWSADEKNKDNAIQYDDATLSPSGRVMPYIITVTGDGKKLLAIRRNWAYGDQEFKRRESFVDYGFINVGEEYPVGLLHLLGNTVMSASTLMRMMMNVTKQKAMRGGFISKALALANNKKDLSLSDGTYKAVSVPGENLGQQIYTPPTGEESAVAMAAFEFKVKEADDITGHITAKPLEKGNEMSAQTTSLLLETQLRVINGVAASFRASFQRQIDIIGMLLAEHASGIPYPFPEHQNATIGEDFADMRGIVLISDPNGITREQKVMRAQELKALSDASPGMADPRTIFRRSLEALGEDGDEIMTPDPAGMDDHPLKENMEMIAGRPAKAHLHQNHDAHMDVHRAALDMPDIQKMIENDPDGKGAEIRGAFNAHNAEHAMMKMVQGTLGKMGVPPDQLEQLTPEQKQQVVPMMADAAKQYQSEQQTLEEGKANLAAMEDPAWQIEQAKLKIERDNLYLKAKELTLKKDTEDDKLLMKFIELYDKSKQAGHKLESDELREAAKDATALIGKRMDAQSKPKPTSN